MKSPEFNTLNKSLSPSSPYFPVKVLKFSRAGVSMGKNPNFLKTVSMVDNRYFLRNMVSGRKSLVPLGKDGFCMPQR
jgi:hypothetical protein